MMVAPRSSLRLPVIDWLAQRLKLISEERVKRVPCPGVGTTHTTGDSLRPEYELWCGECQHPLVRWPSWTGHDLLLRSLHGSILFLAVLVPITRSGWPVFGFIVLLYLLYFGSMLSFSKRS